MGLEGLFGLVILGFFIIFYETIKETLENVMSEDHSNLVMLLFMGYGIYIFIIRDPSGLYEDIKSFGAPMLPILALWRYVSEMKKDLQKSIDKLSDR